MANRTITAFYDSRSDAEAARDALVSAGVPASGISLRGAESGSATTSPTTTATSSSQDRGFWGSQSDLFMPDEDRHTYAEGMSRGGVLLTASVPAGLEDEAVDVLERSGAVDIDERSASWRESGWTGQASDYGAAAGTGASATAAPAAGATAVLADVGKT